MGGLKPTGSTCRAQRSPGLGEVLGKHRGSGSCSAPELGRGDRKALELHNCTSSKNCRGKPPGAGLAARKKPKSLSCFVKNDHLPRMPKHFQQNPLPYTCEKEQQQKKLSKKKNCFGKNRGESSYCFSIWFWGCFAHLKKKKKKLNLKKFEERRVVIRGNSKGKRIVYRTKKSPQKTKKKRGKK